MKYSRIPDIVSYGDGVSVGVVFMCRDNAETNRKCVESYVNNLSNSVGQIQYVLCYGSDKIDVALDSVPVDAQDKVKVAQHEVDGEHQTMAVNGLTSTIVEVACHDVAIARHSDISGIDGS